MQTITARCLLIVSVSGLLPCKAHADDATSVMDFVAEKDRWPRLVGASFNIEGRYSVIGQNSMRFRGCDLEFRIAPGVRLPVGDSLTVEVRGRLGRDGNDLFFDVTRLIELPTDMERLRAMRGGIDGRVAEEWYELADWVRTRGDFYDDDDLSAEAAILSRNGIMTEYQQLEIDDGQGLRALAEKVSGMGLSDTLRMEYVHESLRRDFDATRGQPQPAFAVVLGNVTRLLPGANVQLDAALRDPVIEAYEANPLDYYHQADEATRRRCHRAFYVNLTKRIILASSRENGSNGDSVARRIRDELPEFPELADEWELKFLDYEHSRVAHMSRVEAGELSNTFAERGDEPRAEQVWRDWLAAREPVLRRDGVRGLMQLAGDYEEILDDERKAARLMLEAYEQEKLNHEITDWLREHDYVFVNDQWVLAAEVANFPVDENQRAAQSGIVRTGMSGEDVRRALGSAPTNIVRIASNSRVTELWVYEDVGLSVRFVHVANRGPATVDDVQQLPLR